MIPPGKNLMEEYAKCIAHKSEKLGSARQLPLVRGALSGKLRVLVNSAQNENAYSRRS
jgi:hypothetical protein